MDNFMNNDNGLVLWFTGLAGSGKSSIAEKLLAHLETQNKRVQLLDGDLIRGFCPTGFSKEERNDHVKRVGLMASLLEKHGVIVIASLISPYQSARNEVRKLCKNYHEIYISTSLDVCEKRDVKGLYKKARSREIEHFTGISDTYEVPTNPELSIQTDHEGLETSTAKIISYVEKLEQR